MIGDFLPQGFFLRECKRTYDKLRLVIVRGTTMWVIGNWSLVIGGDSMAIQLKFIGHSLSFDGYSALRIKN